MDNQYAYQIYHCFKILWFKFDRKINPSVNSLKCKCNFITNLATMWNSKKCNIPMYDNWKRQIYNQQCELHRIMHLEKNIFKKNSVLQEWEVICGSTRYVSTVQIISEHVFWSKSLYISPAVSHFYGTEYVIWAGWQYWNKVLGRLRATFEGVSLMFS